MNGKTPSWRRRSSSVWAAAALLAACSDAKPNGAAGSGGVAGSGGAAASAGTAGSGGIAGSGGAAAGAAGSAGIGGSAGGSGGNVAGAAGSNSTGGALGGAGLGGAGSGGAELTSIAAELHEFRLECPCIDPDHFGLDKTDNCDSAPEVDRQTHTKHLGGDPSVLYDVKLRVRGNTEPNTYVNGTPEQERFYVGGETSAPGYTSYMLTVAEPSEVYFFNRNPTVGHLHFLIDYEVVIPMQGGTTLTLEVNGGKSVPDGHGVSNREELVVPDIPPAPDAFNGQFVQFDVISVEPHSGNP